MLQEKIEVGSISKYWQIIITIVAFVVAWTTMKNQITANAKEIDRLTLVVQQLGVTVERVIVLEEHDKNITDDIREIKEDIKKINSKI